MLASRYDQRRSILIGIGLAHAGVATIATLAGAAIGALLTPNADTILLGMALLIGGASALWRSRAPEILKFWPPFPAALIGMLILAIGDRASFIAFTLAARSATPALAGIGLFAGAFALAVAAASLGERRWRALPRRAVDIGGGAVLVLIGLASLASGMRLI